MTIVRWDPFRDLEEMFHRPYRGFLGRNPAAEASDGVDWTPGVDVAETDKEFVIRAELPGVKRNDVEVTLDGNVLTIKGERRYEKEDTTEKLHRKESFHGSFARSLMLPDNTEAGKIRAEARDGVLTVRVPKVQPAKPTAIEINYQ